MSGYPKVYYAVQTGLELELWLAQHLECWDYPCDNKTICCVHLVLLTYEDNWSLNSPLELTCLLLSPYLMNNLKEILNIVSLQISKNHFSF